MLVTGKGEYSIRPQTNGWTDQSHRVIHSQGQTTTKNATNYNQRQPSSGRAVEPRLIKPAGSGWQFQPGSNGLQMATQGQFGQTVEKKTPKHNYIVTSPGGEIIQGATLARAQRDQSSLQTQKRLPHFQQRSVDFAKQQQMMPQQLQITPHTTDQLQISPQKQLQMTPQNQLQIASQNQVALQQEPQ